MFREKDQRERTVYHISKRMHHCILSHFLSDPRFAGIEPFKSKIWLSSPTMHGDEQKWVDQVILLNWVSTVGANIRIIEKQIAELIGVKYAVNLSSCTAALHLATRLAGEKLYGQAKPYESTLHRHRVFASDMTFDTSVNPVANEGGEAIYIDTEYDTWNMSPEAIERAIALYPDVRLVVIAHLLYGTPTKMDELKTICDRHGSLIVEDAAESLGAKYMLNGEWVEAGTIGTYNCISFNGIKLITWSFGGMFLTDSKRDADKVRKWSTQSREPFPWYQHEVIGYNYRMSNIIAGIVRAQNPYLKEHLTQKKVIYERYKAGLSDLPLTMNPFDEEKSQPNFWLSNCIIDKDAMAPIFRTERDYWYKNEGGKSSPQEILEAIAAFGVEGRPIWKPMHMQPIYRTNPFVTIEGNGRGRTNAYISGTFEDVGADIFRRGLCLPSDNKMTPEQQDVIIDIIHRCFL